MRLILHDNNCLELWKQVSVESFTKDQSRIKVPDDGRDLVPDAATLLHRSATIT